MNIIETTRNYATDCHSATNHLYDGMPYRYHLNMVYDFACQFKHLIPEKALDNVLSACWAHDTIEDTRQTYNDVKKATNEQIAELVYALTNEKGKNRKERANDKYYEGIRKTPYATFIKICDRLANVKHSKETNSRMFEMYKKENDEFIKKIYSEEYKEMFDFLKEICK